MRCLKGSWLLSDGRIRYLFEPALIVLVTIASDTYTYRSWSTKTIILRTVSMALSFADLLPVLLTYEDLVEFNAHTSI